MPGWIVKLVDALSLGLSAPRVPLPACIRGFGEKAADGQAAVKRQTSARESQPRLRPLVRGRTASLGPVIAAATLNTVTVEIPCSGIESYLEPETEVVSAASARESKPIKTRTVRIGEGLSAAFRETFARAPADLPPVDHTICDMNGERYRGNEFGFSMLRSAGGFREDADFQTPADCWGDLGAASGPLFAVISRRPARRRTCLSGGREGPSTRAKTTYAPSNRRRSSSRPVGAPQAMPPAR